MNRLENLENHAKHERVEIINYHFSNKRIKGLYCNNTIALNKRLRTQKEKACVLAEELGHFHTTVGDILDQSKTENRKQEYRARVWAYDRLVNLQGIIKAHESGCKTLFEASELLDVTEEFLKESIEHYRRKHGAYVKVDNYVIYFEPQLGVMKMI